MKNIKSLKSIRKGCRDTISNKADEGYYPRSKILQGYPDGLKGEDIPRMARILVVADSVDVMGADRPYRKGRAMDEIIVEVKRCSGMQFDPKMVDVL